jgi:DNA repair protein RecO (recombination protein O)
MSEPVRQEGVVLRKIPYGEADEIVTALFREDGVRRLFAAGSRKSRKRFGGLIDAFARLRFECRPNDAGLWRLHGVEESGDAARTRFWERDIRTYAFFNYLAELICECMPEAVRAGEVFSIWLDAAETFAAREFVSGEAFSVLVRMWAAFGYEMSLAACAPCGGAVGDGTVFVPASGGAVCATCARRQRIASAPALDSGEDGANDLIGSLASFSHLILQKRAKAEEFFLKSIL